MARYSPYNSDVQAEAPASHLPTIVRHGSNTLSFLMVCFIVGAAQLAPTIFIYMEVYCHRYHGIDDQ